VIDTSTFIAALIVDHEHHALARAHLSLATRLPVIVLAEAFSQLRRTFGQSAATASTLLRPWSVDAAQLLPTTSDSVRAVFARASELDLGGNIHDALIAQICLDAGLPLVTLDGRQHRIALALGTRSTYLLA
jgi:predicted nucleic acid-binding protein